MGIIVWWVQRTIFCVSPVWTTLTQCMRIHYLVHILHRLNARVYESINIVQLIIIIKSSFISFFNFLRFTVLTFCFRDASSISVLFYSLIPYNIISLSLLFLFSSKRYGYRSLSFSVKIIELFFYVRFRYARTFWRHTSWQQQNLCHILSSGPTRLWCRFYHILCIDLCCHIVHLNVLYFWFIVCPLICLPRTSLDAEGENF